MVIEGFGLDSRRHSFLILWGCAIHPSQVLVEQDEKQVVATVCLQAHMQSKDPPLPLCKE